VGIIIGGILIQLAYFAFSVNRELYLKDAAKNDANQNLKTVFEVVGPAITQAGEGIGNDARFPVVDIAPFPTGSTDNSEITVRQLKIGTKLRVCENDPAEILTGAVTEIPVSGNSINVPAGCVPVDVDADGYPDDLAKWKSYRESNGGSVKIFVYNGDGVGEELTYTGETISGSGANTVWSINVTGTLTNSYVAQAIQLLMLGEQTYRRDQSTNTLQAIIDGGTPINLISDVGQFNVTAIVRQGSTVSRCRTFPACPGLGGTANWSQIDGIEVTSKPMFDSNTPGLSTKQVEDLNTQAQIQTFFPRNLINF
jgi:hypothetical protein